MTVLKRIKARSRRGERALEALVARQNKLADDYNALLRQFRKNEELVALDDAVAAAKAKLAAAEADNDPLAAARDAERQVRKDV